MTTRALVYDTIERFPGMHFRELVRATGLAIGQLQYHVHALAKAHDIVAYRLFRHMRYCTPAIQEPDRALLGVLRLPVCKNIVIHLLDHSGAHCGQLSAHVNVAPSTFSWYVARLEKLGIVAKERHGQRNCVHLCEPERVKDILAHYRESFTERSVRGFMDAWRPR
jgi:predicted transcriptional regulator